MSNTSFFFSQQLIKCWLMGVLTTQVVTKIRNKCQSLKQGVKHHQNGNFCKKNTYICDCVSKSTNKLINIVFQVKFQHRNNDGRPLELDLNHTTAKLQNKDDVLIVASLSGSRINLHTRK